MAASLPLFVLAVAARLVSAHDHPDEAIPDGAAISPEPIDAILWWHIIFMILSFGIMFPVGMVLGMVRSRWHVPCQAAGATVALAGWCVAAPPPRRARASLTAPGSWGTRTRAGSLRPTSTRGSRRR